MTVPPEVRRRQQELARRLRRVPGYRWAVTTALPAVRRNPTLTDLAWRVFSPGHGAGEVDVPFHGGRYLTGPDVSLVPLVGVLALGLDETQAEALVEDVARLQRETGSFRPLLLLDQPVFAAARRHGYVLDVITPLQGWAGDEASWRAHVAGRLGAALDHYRLWQVLRVTGAGLDELDVALLHHLGDRLPPGLRVSVRDESGDAGETGPS